MTGEHTVGFANRTLLFVFFLFVTNLQAFGVHHESHSHQHNVSNPNYAQIIASNDILDDILSEHERVYEEVFARRKSSCIHPECIYANVERKASRSSIRKSLSQNNLDVIDEAVEQGTSDEGIIGLGEQLSVKKLNNLSVPPLPRSPRIGFARNAVSYSAIGSQKETDNTYTRDADIRRNKDSGYVEELFEGGIETLNLDSRLVEQADDHRKPSLHM